MSNRVFTTKPSKAQWEVLKWWAKPALKDSDGIIADGAIRSGKTLSMSLAFGCWAMESFNHQNFIMSGKTVGSFRRNVLRNFKLMMEDAGYKVADKRTENMVVISQGAVENYFFIFGGKDEASQDLVQGITAAGAFFDEVALMPESFVNQATARCSVDGSKFWFNCNPAGPMHWFKVNWIDQKEKRNIIYRHFTMDDNASLTEAIKKRYSSQYVGVFHDRYIKGLWVAAEGIIYDMFKADTHVKEIPEDELEERVFISSDFGIQNANVFLLWRKVKGSNVYYCCDEDVYSGRDEKKQRTITQLADALDNKLEKYKNLNIDKIIIDPSAAAMIAELRRRGYHVQKAANDVVDGIADTAKLLEQERLIFSPKCKETITEFGIYAWDAKAADRGDDKPIKEHDHSMDAVRYFVRTMRLAKETAGASDINNLMYL